MESENSLKKRPWYKWELLLLLWFAFFFNQADRQIFNFVIPLVKTDLGLTEGQLGLVASIFVFSLGICIPIGGIVGDYFNRKWVIAGSLLFWSIATFFTGYSISLLHLILFRSIAVGGGESFYAPAANALIGEYHKKTRAVAMSIHQTALYAGVIVSGFLVGSIAERYGWRYSFVIFGSIGCALSVILALRLENSIPKIEAKESKLIKEGVRAFFKKPTVLLLTFAFAGMIFVNVGYMTWMPTFLYEKFHLSLRDAGFSSMFYHHAAAFVGVMISGKLSDAWVLTNKKARMVILTGALLAGAPFIVWMAQADGLYVTYFALAVFGLFRGFYDANIYATLFDFVEPAHRSITVGLFVMFGFLIGSLSPALLGYLKPVLGMENGLSLLAIGYILAGCAAAIAMGFFFKKDYVSE